MGARTRVREIEARNDGVEILGGVRHATSDGSWCAIASTRNDGAGTGAADRA